MKGNNSLRRKPSRKRGSDKARLDAEIDRSMLALSADIAKDKRTVRERLWPTESTATIVRGRYAVLQRTETRVIELAPQQKGRARWVNVYLLHSVPDAEKFLGSWDRRCGWLWADELSKSERAALLAHVKRLLPRKRAKPPGRQ